MDATSISYLSLVSHVMKFRMAYLCVILMMTPAFYMTQRYAAHGPAWYNELAGGVQGGAALRMPRNFWGYSSREVLPFLSQNVQRTEGVFWHNATGIAVHHYRLNRWLSMKVNNTGDWTYPYAHWGVYHDQREKKPEELDLWWAYGSEFPVDGFFIDGVQQIGVYKNHRAPLYNNKNKTIP